MSDHLSLYKYIRFRKCQRAARILMVFHFGEAHLSLSSLNSLKLAYISCFITYIYFVYFSVEVGQCVATCEGIPDGHYTSCDSCTEYVSCGGGQFFGNRPCKTCSDEDITCEELYWNDILKYCTPTPSTCIPNSEFLD